MMHAVPFRAEHVFAMRVQPAQIGLLRKATIETLRRIEGPHADTLMRGAVPIACAGAFELWENRALLWSFISLDAGGPVFPALHKIARRYVDGLPYRRIETAVDVNFAAGQRWVELLGFDREADCMRAYQPDGTDCVLYAKVKP